MCHRISRLLFGLRFLALAFFLSGVFFAPAKAAVLPADFEDALVAAVGGPTALAFTPDERLLITTQGGQVRVYQNGALLAAAALNLSSKICTNSERGVLGIAVDPNFSSNRYIYLYYTFNKTANCGDGSPVNRVARFVLSDNNTIAAASETVLIDNIQSPAGNHNGGDLHFGKDDLLYVSVGDGGCDYAGDSGCAGANDAARDRHVMLGKILRVTRDGAIPATNPYQGANSGRCAVTGRTTTGNWCQETFASGLRNPFRIAFDSNAAATRFFINDVGQNVWEEIDEGLSGADYGWNIREGHCANGSTTNCGAPPTGLTNPVFDYPHTGDCSAAGVRGNSITGGAFVPNGIWSVGYDNSYLVGEYVCGKIFKLTPNGSGGYAASEFATGLGSSSAVTLIFGPFQTTKALYYTSYEAGGQVRRIRYTGAANRNPVASFTAAPTSGSAPLDVMFDASASSDPDNDTLSYSWNFGDGTSGTGATPVHRYAANGTYNPVLTVSDGRGGINTSTVRIDVGNSAPTPTIIAPTTTKLFRVGETITLQGSATDAQDGNLADNRLMWEVILHHNNNHTHPFLSPTTGNNIAFTAPAPEDLNAATGSFLEIRLTATDSQGLSRTITQSLQPRKVNVTLATTPNGLNLTVNGTTVTGPNTFVSWDGYALNVNAPNQTFGGQQYNFQAWSDGGAAAHIITTPATAATYTATFTAQTYEGDAASRPNGDGLIQSNDVTQTQRFEIGLDRPFQSNEFQRADAAPFSTRGNGIIDSADTTQAQRYEIGLDPRQIADGPTAPLSGGAATAENSMETSVAQSPANHQRQLRVESATSSAGQQVTVNIRVDAVGDESGYGFTVNYNDQVLTNPSVAIGTAGGSRFCNFMTSGQITCSVRDFAANNPNSSTDQINEIAAGDNQLLVRVTFTVAAGAQAGTTDVTLSGVNASNDLAQNLAITSQNGTVTVTAPTAAAGVSVSGRVTTAQGRGISSVQVTMTGGDGITRRVRTTSFGYYRFDEVTAGETVTLTAKAKRFDFTEATVVRTVNEDAANVDFIAKDN